VSFPAVDANLITDKLTIRIASIDGIAAENAARQKKINIMPEKEWNAMIQKNPAVRQNIECALLLKKFNIDNDRLYKIIDELMKEEIFYNINYDWRKDKKLTNDLMKYFQYIITAYTEVLKIKPNNIDALIGRGYANLYLSERYKSYDDFFDALKINPTNTMALKWLGIGMLNRSNIQAIDYYTTALKINPNDADVLNLRGVAYLRNEDKIKAIADFEASLKINPKNTIVNNNLERARGR